MYVTNRTCRMNGCFNEVNPNSAKENRRTVCYECEEYYRHLHGDTSVMKWISSWSHTTKNRNKHEFTIDSNYIASIFPRNLRCPIFDKPFERGTKGQQCKWSPTLDRIDSNMGYVEGNVQIISSLANSMKQNASTEELLMFAEYIIGRYALMK